MQDTNETPPPSHREGRVMTFARKHPVLAMAGIGGAGLLGGAELAGGILIGAGLHAMLSRRGSREKLHVPHSLREKSRAFAERMPPVVRQRARAIVDAARGKQRSAQQEQKPAGATPDPDQPIESWTV
jgi:hypothetical protein